MSLASSSPKGIDARQVRLESNPLHHATILVIQLVAVKHKITGEYRY
jgi:hypothetical protein